MTVGEAPEVTFDGRDLGGRARARPPACLPATSRSAIMRGRAFTRPASHSSFADRSLPVPSGQKMPRNIEVKARARNFEDFATRARQLAGGAEPRRLTQSDTFYPWGRAAQNSRIWQRNGRAHLVPAGGRARPQGVAFPALPFSRGRGRRRPPRDPARAPWGAELRRPEGAAALDRPDPARRGWHAAPPRPRREPGRFRRAGGHPPVFHDTDT
jgi:hypothetical protein